MTVEQMRTNAAKVLKDDYSLGYAKSEGRKSFWRYAEYRDSGVEWIGEVPAGWEVRPLKFTATINDDTLLENTDPDFEFDYVDIGSVDYVEGISSKETMTFENAPSRARRIVKSGDTIVSTVRERTSGQLHLSENLISHLSYPRALLLSGRKRCMQTFWLTL